MNRSRRTRPEPGFSLVEVLVTLTILAVVAGVLSTVLLASNRTHIKSTRRAQIQGASRQAMSLLTSEIRNAGADPRIPAAGILGVVAADTHAVRVRADMNADGAISTTEPSEDITYTYDAANDRLTRNPGSGAVSALENVTDLRFTYFDLSNAPLVTMPLSATDRALVHSIGITLTTEDRDSSPFTLTTRVTLRNQ